MRKCAGTSFRLHAYRLCKPRVLLEALCSVQAFPQRHPKSSCDKITNSANALVISRSAQEAKSWRENNNNQQRTQKGEKLTALEHSKRKNVGQSSSRVLVTGRWDEQNTVTGLGDWQVGRTEHRHGSWWLAVTGGSDEQNTVTGLGDWRWLAGRTNRTPSRVLVTGGDWRVGRTEHRHGSWWLAVTGGSDEQNTVTGLGDWRWLAGRTNRTPSRVLVTGGDWRVGRTEHRHGPCSSPHTRRAAFLEYIRQRCVTLPGWRLASSNAPSCLVDVWRPAMRHAAWLTSGLQQCVTQLVTTETHQKELFLKSLDQPYSLSV